MSIQPAPGPEATPPRAWVRPDLDGGPIDDPTPVDLPVLLAEVLAVDLTGSAPITRLERLSSLGAIDAALHTLRLETIASLSPAEPADHWAERHVVEELRLAMGVSDRYADALLGQARAVFGAHFTEPDPATAGAEVVQTEPGDVELGGTQLEQGEAGDADGDGTYEPGHAAPFAVMGPLLAAGLTSPAHVRVLAQVTANVADDPTPPPGEGGCRAGARGWRSREDKLTEIATRSRRAAARSAGPEAVPHLHGNRHRRAPVEPAQAVEIAVERQAGNHPEGARLGERRAITVKVRQHMKLRGEIVAFVRATGAPARSPGGAVRRWDRPPPHGCAARGAAAGRAPSATRCRSSRSWCS